MPEDGLEQREQVVHVRDEIAENDVVERPLAFVCLARCNLEAQVRVPSTSELDHSGADVDPDAGRRINGREQISASAADLEYPVTRRNLEAVDILDQTVVRLVA